MEYPTITRLYRVAIRLGDHYITLEEQITLLTDATDEELAQAIALGQRIYHVQQAAIQEQLAKIPDAHHELVATPPPTPPPVILEPEAPATPRQRALIDRLARAMEWTTADLERFAQEHGVTFAAMTKGEASRLIDTMKQLLPVNPTAPTEQT